MGRPNQKLRSQIRRVVKGGRSYRGQWLQVRVGRSDPGRTLISVRKKYGGAVRRNLARRRLRAICQGFGIDSLQGHLLLISLRDEARGVLYRQLRSDLFTALAELSLVDR